MVLSRAAKPVYLLNLKLSMSAWKYPQAPGYLHNPLIFRAQEYLSENNALK